MGTIEKALAEHTRMGLDLRRELFGQLGELAGQTRDISAKFSAMEAVLEAKVTSIDGQLESLRRHVEEAEAQMPADGRILHDNFTKMAAEINTIKAMNGIPLTKAMLEELENMRRHVVEHDARLVALANAETNMNMWISQVGATVAVQEGRVAGLEQHTAQLLGSI